MKLFALLISAAVLVIAQVAEPDALGLHQVTPRKTLNTSQFKHVTILGVHPNNHNGNHSGKDRHTGFTVTPHIVSVDEINNINSAGALDPLQAGQVQKVIGGQAFRSSITTPPVAALPVVPASDNTETVAPTPNAPSQDGYATPAAPVNAIVSAAAPVVSTAPADAIAPAAAAAPVAAPAQDGYATPAAVAPVAPVASTAAISNSSLIPAQDQQQVSDALEELKDFLEKRIAKLPADEQKAARAKAATLSSKVKEIIMNRLGNITLSDGTVEEHRQASAIIAKVKNNMEAAGGLLMSSIDELTTDEVAHNATKLPADAPKAEVTANSTANYTAEIADTVEASIEQAMKDRDQTAELAQKVTEKAMGKVETELRASITDLSGKEKNKVIEETLAAEKEQVQLSLKTVKTASEAEAIIAGAVSEGKTKAAAEAKAITENKAEATELAAKSIEKVSAKLKAEAGELPAGPEKERAEAKIDAREAKEVKALAKKLTSADTTEEAQGLIAEEEEKVTEKGENRIATEKKAIVEKEAEEEKIVAEVDGSGANYSATNATVNPNATNAIADAAVGKVMKNLEAKIATLPEGEQAIAEVEAKKVVAKTEKNIEEKLKTGQVDANNPAAVQELAQDTTKTLMKREARRQAVKEEVNDAKTIATVASKKSEKIVEKATVALEKLEAKATVTEAKEKTLEAKVAALEGGKAPAAAGGYAAEGNATAPTGLLKKLEAKIKVVEAKEAKVEKKEIKEEVKEKEKSSALRDAHNKLVEDLKSKVESLQDAAKDVAVLKTRVANLAANQTSDRDLLHKLEKTVGELSKVEVKSAEALKEEVAKKVDEVKTEVKTEVKETAKEAAKEEIQKAF